MFIEQQGSLEIPYKKYQFGGRPGYAQWGGAVSWGGMFYGIPMASNKILVYDPLKNEHFGSKRVPVDIDKGHYQWSGGVAVQKKIFGQCHAQYIFKFPCYITLSWIQG